MVLFNRKVAVLIAIVFSFAFAEMVSAAIYYTPTYANVSENFMLNITVSAPALTGNISELRVNNYANPPFSINATSNYSGSPGQYFSQIPGGNNFKWFNASGTGLVNATQNQSFTLWMNNTLAGAPSNYRFEVCIYNSTNTSTTRLCTADDPYFVEVVNITIGINFGFTGYVKNETGGWQNQTNVTIYDYVTSAGGPPSEVPIMSALTDGNGLFRLWGVNGSKSLYKLKMFWANSSTPARVHYVGTNLPPFPGNMFYPVPPPPGSENMPKFKKMPNINGSIFYLQPAATINISARGNTTPGAMDVQFGYEVVDQAVGFPIESNIRTGVWNKEVNVPIGRSYTIIAMRDPITFSPDYAFCMSAPGSMNATACPAPPTSAEVLSANLTQGGYVNKVMNLSFTMQYLSGCINLSGNTSKINITNVITRLTPWAGFVPPIDAKISTFNISNSSTGYAENIVYNDQVKCAGYDAFYNMSLMGSSNGIGYLIEFYGKNASDVAGNPGSAVNLAAFQNLTMNESSKFMNVTLKPLAGAYQVVPGASLNTSRMKIFVHNSSGSDSANAITTSMHVEIKVKHPVFGTMHYIVEDISGGITYLPILANSTWAKISVYPNEAPPVEKTLNLLATQNNITLQVGEMTFRKPLSNGSLDSQGINVSNKDIDPNTGVNMTFYRNGVGCNTPNPPSSCILTQMNANDFNPMVVMMAGKVNLELKMTGSGTTLYFINFDLMSAKPPTNSIMSNNASSASANAQVWEAGSFVPHVYDYAYVVMPYSVISTDSNYINESYSSFNMSIPHFKDENWVKVWNNTNNDTTQLPDDYADYNVGAYAALVTDAGAACSLTNTTAVCYWDKGNNSFVLKVPHFSGVGSSITGTAPAGTAAETAAATTGSTGATTGAVTSESRTFATVTKDSENTYRLSDQETIGVNAVLFTATEDLESVRVTVSKLTSKPSSVSTPVGGLYRYIEVSAPKLEGKTKEAKIQFEVTKAWLDSNDYAAEDVILMRFANDKWNVLTTSKLSEDSSKAYYEAVSPGFSYFAITAQKEAEEEPAAEEATNLTTDLEVAPIAAAVEEQASKISLTWLWITIGVLVVIFLAVLGFKKKSLLIFWREPTDKERQEIIRGEFLSRKKQQSWGSGKD